MTKDHWFYLFCVFNFGGAVMVFIEPHVAYVMAVLAMFISWKGRG